MPSVNLRLTDTQHEELVAAAHRNLRSLQKEMVYRLFQTATSTTVLDAVATVEVGESKPGKIEQPLSVARAPQVDSPQRPCRRKHLHHLNHGGKPCPECGWPT